MANKIIIYYQTFCSIAPLLQKPYPVTHIHLSSIHFGTNPDSSAYIHLNDHSPDDPKFNNVWKELTQASKLGIKIVLMVGGAGGAFGDLFSEFETYYKLLYDTIKKYPIICGIDLDVEEGVDIDNIKMLINRINDDFGEKFIISMAPVAYALEGSEPGFGGFVYKDLYNSPEGQRINYFNGQFYGCFDFETYDTVINNGFPPEKVVIGMISGDFNTSNFTTALNTVKSIKNKYPKFGGVFNWEYFDSPPDAPAHPESWAIKMHNALYPPLTKLCKWVIYKIYETFFIW